MSEKILIGDKWYVAATSSRSEERLQVLKHGQSFALFDHFGDIQPGDQGLYHHDTRFLSLQELTIDGVRPLFLGATVKEANSLLTIDLMNPDLMNGAGPRVLKGTLHIFRAKLLWHCVCYEHLRLTNHGLEPVAVRMGLRFAADFVDLFQVRGTLRERAGDRLAVEVGPAGVALPYRGLDGVMRCTRLRFDPPPGQLDTQYAGFDLKLQPAEEVNLYWTIACEADDNPPPAPRTYIAALRENNAWRACASRGHCSIETSNPLVNRWIERSLSDLAMLTTELPSGPYPYAGVPWYSTTFGRDGILTAMLCLWMDPTLAAGVLGFLAAHQADQKDPRNDAEPGKILHEARFSEMARTGEIPFRRYYGTVDATPLFVALAGAYHRRTGDTELIRRIWPQLMLALQWIDLYGDVDADGFVEYARQSKEGLVQQGWKDSADSIFHDDGRLADAPIALCEVQGYVYQAKTAGAELARHLGEPALAERLEKEARDLRERFNRQFWCEDLGTYAIALDGRKQCCRVPSSNAGHALWSGIATPEHAERIVAKLLGDESFSGWGIRTIPVGQPRYNPMSYHNGSIWPHDNALIACGMAQYGYTEQAKTLLACMFEASLHFEHLRLPELFCGFPRRVGEAPARYPVACSPQAWAAATVFGMLQACLGVEVRSMDKLVTLQAPQLPPFIDSLVIRGLGMPDCSVDLLLKRHEGQVGIEVLRKASDLQVLARL